MKGDIDYKSSPGLVQMIDLPYNGIGTKPFEL